MLLYIIRHGDPDYVTDSLTQLGLLQAEAVGARLAKAGIDKVFSSSMGRAMQTAAPTCRLLGLECIPQDWARELQGEMFTHYPNGKRKSMGMVPAACFGKKAVRTWTEKLRCKVLPSGMPLWTRCFPV